MNEQVNYLAPVATQGVEARSNFIWKTYAHVVGAILAFAAIEVYRVDLPYAGGVYALSGGRSYQSFDATIVRLATLPAHGPRGGRCRDRQPVRW